MSCFRYARAFFLFTLAALFPSYSHATQNSATLHVFFVVTADELLRESTRTDLKSINAVLETGTRCKFDIKRYLLREHEFSIANLAPALQTLPIKPNDSVMFYYSGHGVVDGIHNTKWPMIAANNNSAPIPLHHIHELFKTINPRLLIVMADCCNSDNTPTNDTKIKHFGKKISSFSKKKTKTAASRKKVKILFSRLFFEKKGHITIAASKRRQIALATDLTGGVMTRSFAVSFIHGINKSRSDWKSVLLSTKKLCKKFHQTPHYHIKITKANGTVKKSAY